MTIWIVIEITEADLDYTWDYDSYRILGVYDNKAAAEEFLDKWCKYHNADLNDSWQDEDDEELTHYVAIEEHKLRTESQKLGDDDV